jgi:hypothetical protein
MLGGSTIIPSIRCCGPIPIFSPSWSDDRRGNRSRRRRICRPRSSRLWRRLGQRRRRRMRRPGRRFRISNLMRLQDRHQSRHGQNTQERHSAAPGRATFFDRLQFHQRTPPYGVIRQLRDLVQPSTEVPRGCTRLRLHLQIIYHLNNSSNIAGDLLSP